MISVFWSQLSFSGLFNNNYAEIICWRFHTAYLKIARSTFPISLAKLTLFTVLLKIPSYMSTNHNFFCPLTLCIFICCMSYYSLKRANNFFFPPPISFVVPSLELMTESTFRYIEWSLSCFFLFLIFHFCCACFDLCKFICLALVVK